MANSKIYGLFSISYDYYKWEDIIAASESVDNLKAHYKSLTDNLNNNPLISVKESEEMTEGRSEKYHYVIIELKRV